MVDEGCATSCRLKWDPIPPNEVGRITQHVRKGERRISEERRKEGMGYIDLLTKIIG
jgi:hypothetical protein